MCCAVHQAVRQQKLLLVWHPSQPLATSQQVCFVCMSPHLHVRCMLLPHGHLLMLHAHVCWAKHGSDADEQLLITLMRIHAMAGSDPCVASLDPVLQAALSLDAVTSTAAYNRWYNDTYAEVFANAPLAPPIPSSNPQGAASEAGTITISGMYSDDRHWQCSLHVQQGKTMTCHSNPVYNVPDTWRLQ